MDHGAEVALPVFRSVADKLFHLTRSFSATSPENAWLLLINYLRGERISHRLFKHIQPVRVPVYSGGGITDFIVTRKVGSDVNLMAMNEPAGLVPMSPNGSS